MEQKTRNTLLDLNNHLFEQLERINDEDLTDEELERELKRTDAMTKIAEKITDNADIVFKATKLNIECSGSSIPRVLIGNKEKNNDINQRIGTVEEYNI